MALEKKVGSSKYFKISGSICSTKLSSFLLSILEALIMENSLSFDNSLMGSIPSILQYLNFNASKLLKFDKKDKSNKPKSNDFQFILNIIVSN